MPPPPSRPTRVYALRDWWSVAIRVCILPAPFLHYSRCSRRECRTSDTTAPVRPAIRDWPVLFLRCDESEDRLSQDLFRRRISPHSSARPDLPIATADFAATLLIF